MSPQDFKTAIKNQEQNLKGKTFEITFIDGNTQTKMTLKGLKAFGLAVLNLEAKGASFGFSSVQNSLIERATQSIDKLTEKLNCGKWNQINITATTVK